MFIRYKGHAEEKIGHEEEKKGHEEEKKRSWRREIYL